VHVSSPQCHLLPRSLSSHTSSSTFPAPMPPKMTILPLCPTLNKQDNHPRLGNKRSRTAGKDSNRLSGTQAVLTIQPHALDYPDYCTLLE
jgi:hypothetical protein